MLSLSTEQEFTDYLNKNERNTVIVHFGAEWAPQCKQINDILSDMTNQSVNTLFVYVEADKLPKIALQYKITGVPTLLFIKHKQVVQTIKGGNPRDLLKAIKELAAKTSEPISEDVLNNKLKGIINSAAIMLFMKGSPDAPQCGFSRRIVQILTDCNADYKSFDILTDSDVREGLKKYSNWPTYPQLYINGELVGGVDIVAEMAQNGELANMVKDASSAKKAKLEERLKCLINKDRVVLFMKGSPDEPRCGFSRNTVAILKNANIEFGHFDILSDSEVREGLKAYSDWPTYPQLYVKGELLGGFDIIKEMSEAGELAAACAE